MNIADKQYVSLPWKKNGRSRQGLDCAGLAWLFLSEQFGLQSPSPRPNASVSAADIIRPLSPIRLIDLSRGDCIFFRHQKTKALCHVAVYLGDGKLLNILAGCQSRIENGFTLLARLGLEPVAAIPPREADKLAAALSDASLGWVQIAIMVVLMALSYAINYRHQPTAGKFRNITGKYGSNNSGLVMAKNPEIPLPDILGRVVVAGNSVYQQLPDRSATVSNDPPQAWNQVVILDSAPCSLIDIAALQINGINYSDATFHSGTNLQGMAINPALTKDEAISGTIGGDTLVPSVTVYDGAYDISVPMDVRSSYDRTFPVYRFSGCSYLVFRFIDSSKFPNLNITVPVVGRLCRDFDDDGFLVSTSTNESLADADGTKVRFKLAYADIASVSALTVNGTAFAPVSASAQTGNVYHLNATKGYVEFLTAPANEAEIIVSYSYYPRAFTANPARHLAYLLTEPRRGKGFAADRLDWPSFHAAADYFDTSITWVNSNGAFTGPRYQTNYSIDVRKPIQDHLQALLDACHSSLFLASGKFTLLPIKAESSVFSFDTTNILLDDSGRSTFEATQMDRANKANRLRLSFHSEDTLNSETEVVADDDTNQRARSGRAGDNGIVEEQLKFPAITTFPQAERLAETILAEHVLSNWAYKWTTSIQGLALMPGDLVDVTHPSLPIAAKLLRIDSLEHDELDRLSISASEYVPSAYF
jgi:hypothetical protein